MTAADSSFRSPRPLVFGYDYAPFGSHPAAITGSSQADPFDPSYVTGVAQLAEAAGFTFIRFGDRALDRGGVDSVLRTEPITTASFVATRTSRIGFVVTANTSYHEPFNVTRLIASLDHVTHGRAGWQLLTATERAAAASFATLAAPGDDHRARAAETIVVARKLWDSWGDAAFVRDKATGAYVDGTKISSIEHEGDLFRVKGPLNVARSPQGHPVLAIEVVSDETAAFAAREADLVLLGNDEGNWADIVRQETRRIGRDPAAIRFLRRFAPVIAETREDGQALLATLEQAEPSQGGTRWIAGSPTDIADILAEQADRDGLDGFLFQFAQAPDQLQRFAALLAPELRRRHLLVDSAPGATFRDRLGLARVADRFAA
ncbi:LLM class flavin-dependent oxidoreductase [Sphingomonas sp. AP4-R1]|uniref:LLM class flavin-dependent oxidoreductase n=1 Tax=Sphingomonas sp. AP4-R1 TaxID=2735134 RepID=UPI0014937792|nr:LLM class flavin-dependent oxidoreductase [Sphingomonas sp. AP4-R1]QJU57366.1 LLM class flavin-dependent oxidoreductase [Sphingomonas sp. AP4-R1]